MDIETLKKAVDRLCDDYKNKQISLADFLDQMDTDVIAAKNIALIRDREQVEGWPNLESHHAFLTIENDKEIRKSVFNLCQNTKDQELRKDRLEEILADAVKKGKVHPITLSRIEYEKLFEELKTIFKECGM